MAEIALRDIEKYFGDNYVIRKLNLAIQHREFLVLLGPYDIVDLKLGKQLLRCRTASGYVERAGDTVWARLDEKQTHFFDQGTGESLGIRL